MKTRAKKAAAVLAAGLMTVAMTGMSQVAAQPARAATASGGTFTFYTIDDGAGFDPALFSWDARQDEIGIFEGLVHFGKDFKVVPGIATSWTTKGNVWTFHLRHDARFSNGDPVTAQDFVYSIRRAINPATAAAAKHASSYLGDVPILNANRVVSGYPVSSLGVKALGDYTLQMTLSKPDPNLLTQLATDMWQLPVDPKVVQGQPETIWSNPATVVSDGPYMLSQYTSGTDEILVPNPYYYKKVPLKEIHILVQKSGVTELLPFENNQSDEAVLESTDVPAVMSNPTLKAQLHHVQTAVTYTLQVQPSLNPALQNLKVRQAFAMAVNKQAIADDVLLGTGVPAYDGKVTTWMAPWIAKDSLQYNPTEAQKLMAQAGYPGGKGFPTVVILTAAPDPVAEAIQQMWQQTLGVTVDLNEVAWGTYLTDLKQVLPANEVGYTQYGQGPQFPNWETVMPTDLSGVNATNVPLWSMNGADQAKYEALQAESIAGAEKNQLSEIMRTKDMSPAVRAVMEMGVKGLATDNVALMKKYVIAKNHLAYVVPVYTVDNSILIRSDVHGYYPMRMWLATPPVWLGYITVS